MFFSIPAEYFTVPCQDVPIDYELFLNDIVTTPSYGRVTTPFILNNSPRSQALNQQIRHTMITHADTISRVNRIDPQYRSPALMRQIQLLESQHEQFLRRIHDVEVLRRSDNTRVHRHSARNSPPGLRNDRWLRFNGHHHTHNRAHNGTNRCPQPRRPRLLQPQSVPISRRPVNPRRPRILPPFREPQRR